MKADIHSHFQIALEFNQLTQKLQKASQPTFIKTAVVHKVVRSCFSISLLLSKVTGSELRSEAGFGLEMSYLSGLLSGLWPLQFVTTLSFLGEENIYLMTE